MSESHEAVQDSGSWCRGFGEVTEIGCSPGMFGPPSIKERTVAWPLVAFELRTTNHSDSAEDCGHSNLNSEAGIVPSSRSFTLRCPKGRGRRHGQSLRRAGSQG